MSVSRLDKDKRINIIIEALPKILTKCDIQFVPVGKGVEKENLAKLARKLGVEKNITFPGFVPDEELPSMYAAADCFVLACPYELQSLATMEAMATGKPAIVVDALALPELVHSGENGYLFPENDSEALADAVIKIMTDKELRKKMGEKSLEIIGEHDIDKSAGKYEAFYKEIIEKHKNS
jgi:glycosyltransferase involved in cell wall biosynthesis